MSTQSRLKALERKWLARATRESSQSARRSFQKYRLDPVGYVRDVLGATLTPDQELIARAMIEPPYRVMATSGHNIGKSFLSAAIINWWYDTRDPSAVISTAPTHRDVVDLLWTEVRLQRQRAGLPDDFIGPSAPEMRTGEEHYAKGFTSSTGESFQGRHRPNMLFVFEEAEGIDGVYWQTAGTMFQPDGTCGFLAILNPTTTTSASYQEERAVDARGNPKWNVFRVSSLNHPNIAAQLSGKPPLIPSAVTLEQVWTWLGDWFEPIAFDSAASSDIEFPPGSGQWYRPGPEGESRVLGRRPSAGTFGVWSESLWRKACQPREHTNWPGSWIPEIGADVARYGDDLSEIHVRCGPVSLLHESHSGWDTVRLAERITQLAEQYAEWATRQRPSGAARVQANQIRIKVDDTGVGGGVTDILRADPRGLSVVAVNAGERASADLRYPRIRDELWFAVVERARSGMLDLSRLPTRIRTRLEVQALAPTWKPTVDRRRQVERKEETKKRLKRSPDGMDALNLAYWEQSTGGVATTIDTRKPSGDIHRGEKRGSTLTQRGHWGED